MGFWTVLLLVVFITSYVGSGLIIKPDTDTLRFVQIVFRHGKRTPVQYFKNDPNNPIWGGVLGELTLEGKRDSYAMGEWFRQQYDGFLSEYKSSNEMSIKSTYVDRTLETAQLFAAAIYPPTEKESWNDDLGKIWQPFPVYGLDLGDSCPRYDQLQSLLMNTPEESRIYNNSKALINQMLEELGEEQGRHDGFFHAFDILMIEKVQNLTYPAWIQAHIQEAEMLKEHYAKNIIKTPEIVRLNIGQFTKSIMDELEMVIKNKAGSRKVSVYSAHDTTVMSLMASMSMFNYIWPPFNGAFILELHENEENQYFLKALYRNDTSHDPYVLHFPNCLEMCSWQKAWDATSPYFMDNRNVACKKMTPEEVTKKQEELNKAFP